MKVYVFIDKTGAISGTYQPPVTSEGSDIRVILEPGLQAGQKIQEVDIPEKTMALQAKSPDDFFREVTKLVKKN
jgi:hypothetical protein